MSEGCAGSLGKGKDVIDLVRSKGFSDKVMDEPMDILLIGIFIWDLVIPKEFNLGLLYNRLLLNYKYWTTFPKELLNTAGFFIVLILLIYTFEHFVNRREFLNE